MLSFPRPLFASLMAVGAIAAIKFHRAGIAMFSLGLVGLGALHATMYYMINGMCVDACTKGDMSNIAATWQIPGLKEVTLENLKRLIDYECGILHRISRVFCGRRS